jgi:hypothetical protein
MANIILAWIGFAIAVGIHGGRRGRTGLGWFVDSVAISPPLAWLLLIALRDRSPEFDHGLARAHLRKCLYCAGAKPRIAVIAASLNQPREYGSRITTFYRPTPVGLRHSAWLLCCSSFS